MPHRPAVLVVILLVGVLTAGGAGCAKRTPESTSDSAGLVAPTDAVDPAKQEGCFANERAVESQVAAYQAQNPGTVVPASVADMVAQGMLRAIPTCPAGGSYSYDAARAVLTCSVHGHY